MIYWCLYRSGTGGGNVKIPRTRMFSFLPYFDDAARMATMSEAIAQELEKVMDTIAKSAVPSDPVFPLVNMSIQARSFEEVVQSQNLGRWLVASNSNRAEIKKQLHVANAPQNSTSPDDGAAHACPKSKCISVCAASCRPQYDNKKDLAVDEGNGGLVRCPNCPAGCDNSAVPYDQWEEHQDWHLALQLHEREVHVASVERSIQQAFANRISANAATRTAAKRPRLRGIKRHKGGEPPPQPGADEATTSQFPDKGLYWTVGEHHSNRKFNNIIIVDPRYHNAMADVASVIIIPRKCSKRMISCF